MENRILRVMLTVMIIFLLLPFADKMMVYADSTSVIQKCPKEVHDECSHSSARYHFYSTGNTYIPENWPSYQEPEYYVEGILYNSDVEAEGVYHGQEKIICAKDTANSFSTSYFKNGFSEGWYYDTGDGLYPCTESSTRNYTLTVIDGSITAGGSGACASVAQGALATIKANDAPVGKVFDKWVVVSDGITTDEAREAVISKSAIIKSTADIVMPNENIKLKATYKEKSSGIPNIITSPANGSIVKNMKEIDLTFPDHSFVYFSNCEESYTYSDAVKNSKGETVCGATLRWGGLDNQIKWTAESEITTAGTYTITIPSGMIKAALGAENGKTINEPITLNYTVSSETSTKYKVIESTVAIVKISCYVDGKPSEVSWSVALLTEENKMHVELSDLKEAISKLGEGVLSKGADIKIKLITAEENGAVRQTILINGKDLEETDFVVYAIDKQGNSVIVNPKQNQIKIKEAQMILNIADTGDFQLFNTADAEVIEKAILKTITPKNKNVSVKKGKKTTFKLSSQCNKNNILKITYKASNKNVKVYKNGTIKGQKKGKATVTATIILKNGKQKKFKMNVKVV